MRDAEVRKHKKLAFCIYYFNDLLDIRKRNIHSVKGIKKDEKILASKAKIFVGYSDNTGYKDILSSLIRSALKVNSFINDIKELESKEWNNDYNEYLKLTDKLHELKTKLKL